MFRRLSSFLVALFVVQFVVAQAPSGYYDAATSQKGRMLKTALHKIINSHVVRSYDNLWEDFKSTDRRPDGKVWDMYSDCTNYTLGGSKQGANYKKEGDSYNREHSFPKSWFGGKIRPMYTDLFHLCPTDGYINNRRSSFPFGETEGETYSSHGNWSKVGQCTVPGYSGTVFEPNDEYKGDFARAYFYMATCYEDKIAGWDSPMLSHDSYTAYASWALKMLMRWAKEDPVSQKEIDRNNAIYLIQKNRNPFVDYPGLEEYVWGSKTAIAFDPNHFDSEGGGEVQPNPEPGDKTVAKPVFSLPSSTVVAGTQVTISTATQGASVYYQINGGDLQASYGSATIVINETSAVEAYAMLGESKSETVKATYIVATAPVGKDSCFVKVYGPEDLVVGAKYLIVSEEPQVALSDIGGYNKDIRNSAKVVIDAKTITTPVSSEGYPYTLTLGQDSLGYTFYDAATDTYLAVTSDKNSLPSIGNGSQANAHWTIDFSMGDTHINNVEYAERSIRYNSDSPRFSTYKGKMHHVALYKENVTVAPDSTEVALPEFSLASGEVSLGAQVTISCATAGASIVYTINGGASKTENAPITLTINEDMTIEAYAQFEQNQSQKVSVTYTIAKAPVAGKGDFVKIGHSADLIPGSRYLIVCEERNVALGELAGSAGDYRAPASVDIAGGVISSEVSATELPYALVLGQDEKGYTFYDEANQCYLAVNSDANKLHQATDATLDEVHWTIVFEDGHAVLRNVKYDARAIKYNYSSPRFATYKSGQGSVDLFKEYAGQEEIIVEAPQFSAPAGAIAKGTKVEITCATEKSEIYYHANAGEWQLYAGNEGVIINEDVTLEAYAKVGDAVSDTVRVNYIVVSEPVEGDGVFVKISSAADLVAGARYLIVNEENETAMSQPTGKDEDVRGVAFVSLMNDRISADLTAAEAPCALTLGVGAEGYTFYDAAIQKYLAFTGRSNRLPSVSEAVGNEAFWTVSFVNGHAEIRNVKDTQRLILYNNNQPRFVAYTETSQQLPVSLFREVVSVNIEYTEINKGTVDVYSLDGRLLRDDVDARTATQGLRRGIYVIGGVKIMVR